MNKTEVNSPVWLMQPIPYFGEKLNGNWIVEPKYDGWRLQIIKCSNGSIKFYGRRLEKNPNWTEKLSYLIEKINNIIPAGTILDCELCTDKGRQYIPSLFRNSFPQNIIPIVYIFDVIFYDNKFVGNLPLRKRKLILNELKFNETFRLTEYGELNDINNQLKNSIASNHEGIVIKELNSKYKLSKDGPVATEFWRKIKV